MEIGSDGEGQIRSGGDGGGNGSSNTKKKTDNSNSGLAKPKRQMKTPFQLETLEKVYAVETYPSEATRAELSEKLGLSDRQLQMWFCHRRLKEKKDVPPKKPRKPPGVQAPPHSPVRELRAGSVPDPYSPSGSGSGSGCSPYSDSRKLFASGSSSSRAGVGDYEKMGRRHYDSRQSIAELRAIACVEAQLGGLLREDGPILGMEFDPLPPGAFGTPIEMQKHSVHPYESKMFEPHNARSSRSLAAARSVHEQQFLDDQSSFKSETYGQYSQIRARDMDHDIVRPRSSSFLHENGPLSRSHRILGNVSHNRSASHQAKPSPVITSAHDSDGVMPEKDSLHLGTEDPYILSDGVPISNDVHRKGKTNEVRHAREIEVQENRTRKELEKLEIQRRKSEERLRKEMERHERERRKEEERLMRERLREEERSQREQRREMERREKFLQKEYQRAEKKRQKEELRQEKEAIRRKVAIERATARRIAKESMDLIEDEQLELMELAAASKGLPSILQLDHDTLQNLEMFRDSLSTFPLKSVQLKRPFAIPPWKDSEENVGNLLMVWRFLISFADVLGLWPFTMDEFIQAFHDYDSRLLGEVHITLLGSIIRDIEDVARTPFTGSGVNQYLAANPEGGHPQIVEGAYAWGFDIRSWQKHLNSLTWPEILRQLALSAGFGPRLKKKSSQWTYLGDREEAKACEDVISTLRNGSAAESAFALMREKGLLLPRKSRHRLTPGTVKFAAFHVLSLEGGKGLTVLELADKIQKSGLRDLTTSKTPEASISVALTRDVKLFERIAPSTYCVRAPYRKDPADAEAILAEARKKIRAFENGFTGAEDAEDVERDEEFECDIDEDPEVDDLATPGNASKSTDDHGETNVLSGSGKDSMFKDVKADVQNEIGEDLSSLPSSSTKNDVARSNSDQCTAGEDTGICSLDNKNVEVDESNQGQSWVQGLTEGDYCHLSVEERLNALVALIGVANEGNTIRAVLEDRMEAANSLKKQMWAEAQLDKSCMRDIIELDSQHLSGSITEPRIGLHIIQSPSHDQDNINEEPSQLGIDQKPQEMVSNGLHTLPAERTSVGRDTNMVQENSSTQHGYASKRSRSQLKSYIGHRAEEMYVYRSLPLGLDRRHNRYWQFATSTSRNDPCSGRIFVELRDGKWRLIDSEEAFEALVTSLDMRGIRESHLRIMLRKIEASFKENVCQDTQLARNPFLKGKGNKNEVAEMDSSPECPAGFDSPSSAICGLNSDSVETSNSFRVELGRNDTEKKNSLKRYQDFQRWMWSESFNSLPSCARKYGKKRCDQILATCELCLDSFLSEQTHHISCHQRLDMVNSFQLSEHEIHCADTEDIGLADCPLPLGVRLLKALLALLEASFPAEALESFWTEDQRKIWGVQLNVSSSPEELVQVLALLESAIKKEYLSSDFATAKELLGAAAGDLGSALVLPWIPLTTSAVALRVSELDASIKQVKQEKPDPPVENEDEQNTVPFGYSPFRSKNIEAREDQGITMKEEVGELGNRRNKRGRLNSDPGSSRRLQRKKIRGGPNRFGTGGKNNVRASENLMTLELSQQGRGINSHQGCGRGRRTVRRRPERRNDDDKSYLRGKRDFVPITEEEESESFRDMDEDWPGETPSRMMTMQAEVGGDDDDDDESGNSIEAVESDDNAQTLERNWGLDWNGNLNEASDEEEEDDDNGVERADVEIDDDAEMSDSSDGNIPNNAGKDFDRESEGSEDYSSDS